MRHILGYWKQSDVGNTSYLRQQSWSQSSSISSTLVSVVGLPDARMVALGVHDARVVDSEALDSLDALAAPVVGTWALQDPSFHGV